MQIIYQYLIRTLLPTNVEAELQGGSMPRNAPSPFVSLHHGRFITGPTNLKSSETNHFTDKIPKTYLFGNEQSPHQEYYLIVYRALSASLCMFVKGMKN